MGGVGGGGGGVVAVGVGRGGGGGGVGHEACELVAKVHAGPALGWMVLAGGVGIVEEVGHEEGGVERAAGRVRGVWVVVGRGRRVGGGRGREMEAFLADLGFVCGRGEEGHARRGVRCSTGQTRPAGRWSRSRSRSRGRAGQARALEARPAPASPVIRSAPGPSPRSTHPRTSSPARTSTLSSPPRHAPHTPHTPT